MVPEIFKELRELLKQIQIPDDIKEKVKKASPKLNSAGFDAWGLDPDTVEVAAYIAHWLYKDYFRVETVGIENIPKDGRVMLISNHGCQIPLDGLLISLSTLLDAEPPRLVRSMVDRWVPSLPFISELFTRCGQIVGAPDNCIGLLETDNSVLIFPEGTKGAGKTIFEKYQLQHFGTGFMRIAIETQSPIIPISIIGTEEIYPSIANFKSIARLLKFPYFPITPLFPMFGILGAIPLPTKVTIRFGKPYIPPKEMVSNEELKNHANTVKEQIQSELNLGLKLRGSQIFTKAAK